MISRNIQEWTSEEDLAKHILSQIPERGKVAIVAGHFMLMFDDRESTLVPMIWQDTNNPAVASFSRKMAGDFPVRSFSFGTSLRERILKTLPKSDPRLVLLTNDHIYQTPPWKSYCPDMNAAGHLALKKAFYRQRHPLPPAFREILDFPNSASPLFVDNNNPSRTRNDILPKQTIFFSEQQLRNRFDKYTREYLRLDPAFVEAPATEKNRRLLFRNPARPNELCLTEEGACGCSGEVIEFLMTLLKKGWNTVVFIFPSACRNAAIAGIEATVYHQSGSRRVPLEVFALFGFGGIGDSTTETNPSITLEHVRNLDA